MRATALTAAMIAAALAAPAGAGARIRALAPSEPPSRATATATLEQCVTSQMQMERSATFAGEMTALPGTRRMLMRIDVLERSPRELLFHAITYPGLGSWLRAAPGVKTFKNLDRVSDLSAPASYRASVRLRWFAAHGRLQRELVLRTPACVQPARTVAFLPGPAAEAGTVAPA